jgi:hypothetical protein
MCVMKYGRLTSSITGTITKTEEVRSPGRVAIKGCVLRRSSLPIVNSIGASVALLLYDVTFKASLRFPLNEFDFAVEK